MRGFFFLASLLCLQLVMGSINVISGVLQQCCSDRLHCSHLLQPDPTRAKACQRPPGPVQCSSFKTEFSSPDVCFCLPTDRPRRPADRCGAPPPGPAGTPSLTATTAAVTQVWKEVLAHECYLSVTFLRVGIMKSLLLCFWELWVARRAAKGIRSQGKTGKLVGLRICLLFNLSDHPIISASSGPMRKALGVGKHDGVSSGGNGGGACRGPCSKSLSIN